MYTWYYCYYSSLSSSFFFLLWYYINYILLSCCCYCFLVPLPVPESELRRWTPRELQAPWPSSCEASVFVRGACFAFSALFQLIGATEELGHKRHITISLDPMCCKDLQAIDTNRSHNDFPAYIMMDYCKLQPPLTSLFVQQPIFLQSYSDYCGVLFEWFFGHDRYHI